MARFDFDFFCSGVVVAARGAGFAMKRSEFSQVYSFAQGEFFGYFFADYVYEFPGEGFSGVCLCGDFLC